MQTYMHTLCINVLYTINHKGFKPGYSEIGSLNHFPLTIH